MICPNGLIFVMYTKIWYSWRVSYFLFIIFMYLLKNFSNNFHFILKSEVGEGWSGAPNESVRPQGRPDDLKAQALKHLSPEQQKRLENLEAIKEEVEYLQAAEKIVWDRAHIIGEKLLHIKDNPTDAANPNDKEYAELVAMFERIEAEYKNIAKDNSQTSHILSYYLAEAEWKVDEQIWDIWDEHNEGLTQEWLTLDQDTQDENEAYTQNERTKWEFFAELQVLGDTISDIQAKEIIEKYGIQEIERWWQEVRDDSPEGESITLLFSSIDTRNFENVWALQTMGVEAFLTQVPHEERLKYFSFVWENYNPRVWETIWFTFRFGGKLNDKLESEMTAGSIIPETISQIKVWSVSYERKWLHGEFISIPKEWETPSRLLLREGDNITIEKIQSTEDIQKEKDRIEKQLEWQTEEQKAIVRQRLLKWLGELDASTRKVIQDSLPQSWAWNYSWAVEHAVNQLATTPWVDGNRLPYLEGKGLLGAIWNFIVDMLQDPKSPVSQAGSVESYAESVWLSAEELKQFWNTGAQLAAWIRSIGYRKFVDKPWNCGANVGEALEAFGFKWLPTSWRDGHLWAQFCQERPSQFKRFAWPVEEAPAGSIISYKTHTGGSKARQKYGHVEIAMGNNTGYYFGQLNKKPGGSNPNPRPGEYEIYVPISKTPKAV